MAARILASLRASAQTQSGVDRGSNPLDVPLWQEAENVIFRDGGVEKVGGFIRLETIGGLGCARGMIGTQDEAGIQRLLFGDARTLWHWRPGALLELGHGYNGIVDETVNRAATVWSFARFGNWVIASNGVDPVQVWKGDEDVGAEDLDGPDFDHAEIVMQSRSYVLAFNTSLGPSFYHWCKSDDATVWAPSSENDAGWNQIRDLNGGIKAAVTIGDAILILGRNQAFILQFVDAPLIWAHQPALTGIGAVGKAACVEANRIVYGLGEMGFWQTDGVNYTVIGSRQIERWLRERWDKAQLSKVSATYDSTKECVIWSIPVLPEHAADPAEPKISVVYSIAARAWSPLSFGRSAWVPQIGAFSNPWAMDGNVLYVHNRRYDAHAAPLPAYVQTTSMDLGNPRIWKYLESIFLQIRWIVGEMVVYIGWQENLGDPVEWDGGNVLTNQYTPIHTTVSGRFLTLKIGSEAEGSDWSITGGDIWGTNGGAT